MGIPKVNESFFVLWRNADIPNRQPIPPPNNAYANKLFSGILERPFIALLLSLPILQKPKMFIRAKYGISISRIIAFIL